MRDRPGHRALRGLDRDRIESFRDLKDLKEHFPRRLRDPWRDTKFSLLAGASSEPPSPDPGPQASGQDDPPLTPPAPPTHHAGPSTPTSAAPAAPTTPALRDAPQGGVLHGGGGLQRAAAAATPDDLMQVLERSSGSTSSGTSDLSGLLLSPRSGLTRRSVSERVLIPEDDAHAGTPSPPAPPSSEREKRAMLRRNLTQILSCVYAVFIVTLGVVVYISSLVAGKSPILAEAFSLYLVGLGLLYLVFLYTDIRRYLNRLKARQAFLLSPPPNVTAESKAPRPAVPPGPAGPGSQPRRPSLPRPRPPLRPVPHDYCFSDASHAASFYLKVGAAGFCFGHLVHSSLLLAYQAMFLIQDPDEFSKCASPATLVLDILYPVYSFLQLFFIFKYSNVIINRCEELARFALMHCLASSLCFWVWTILRETMDSLAHYDHQDAPHEHLEQPEDVLLDYDTDYPAAPLAAPLGSTHAPTAGTGPVAMPLTTYHKRGALDLVKFMNASSLGSSECRASTQLSTVLDSLSPYLYPFTIEYSILVVGVLFVIWQNIGNCSNAVEEAAEADGKVSSAASTSSASSTASSRGSTASLCRPPPMSPQSGFVSNVVLHADCHSANKGLFAGLIVLVGAAISIILFLLAMADSEYMEVGLTVNSVTELTLLALMTVAVMAAYCRLAKLDVVRRSSASVSLLDHLLLFLCIPAFFLYAIFSIVPALEQRSYLSITTILLQVTQVLVQTPFIMDGMRRCSNCVKLRLQKPGRELVTFLIVCNVALWITDTFEIKSVDARDHRADYYGRVLWTMISHATVPLTMLYRFHSSGCLVHIWKSAYEADRLH